MTKQRVAVLGAGIIGVFCALRLAEEGFAVVVLEQQRASLVRGGPTASLAAAGMLAPVSEAAAHAGAHPQADALACASFDLWRARARDASWNAFLNFDGALFAPVDGGVGLARKAQAIGRQAALLNTNAVRRELGAAREHTPIMYVADEGVLDPVRMHAALIEEAAALGVEFRYDFAFDGFGAVSVYDAALAPIPADHVVIAPGAFADLRLAEAVPLLKRLRPAKGQLMEIESAQTLRLTLHAPDFYIARRWNGDLILGASMEWDRDDTDVDPAQTKRLLEAANAFFGGGVSAKPGAVWAGVRPMSPDGGPLVGPVRAASATRAFLAAGHGRNGWLLAPITAEMISAYVSGKPVDPLWAAFDPARFERPS